MRLDRRRGRGNSSGEPKIPVPDYVSVGAEHDRLHVVNEYGHGVLRPLNQLYEAASTGLDDRIFTKYEIRVVQNP